MADLGVWAVGDDKPKPLQRRAQVDLEKDLESWIAADSALLPGGLTIVGRQVWLDSGALDLLAFDGQDRWVVVEIKRGRLYREALAQAMDYSSSIAGLDASDLRERLQPGLAALGDAEHLSQEVQRLLDGEEETRDVDVLLVGVGVDPSLERIDPSLERIVGHLRNLGMSIGVVTFEAFELDGGPRLLIREVTEQQEEPPPPAVYTLDALHRRASEAGSAEEFRRFVDMCEHAGLSVRPYKVGVKIAHPADLRWRLIWANPRNSGLFIGIDPAAFARFYDSITEERVVSEIGLAENWRDFAGSELDERLGRIERFFGALDQTADSDSSAGYPSR